MRAGVFVAIALGGEMQSFTHFQLLRDVTRLGLCAQDATSCVGEEIEDVSETQGRNVLQVEAVMHREGIVLRSTIGPSRA